MQNKTIQFKLNALSMLINLAALFLMGTAQYCISVEVLSFKENIWYGLFTFSDDNIVRIIESSPDMVDESFWGNYYGIRVVFAVLILISLVYLVHHLFAYTFLHKRTDENYFIIDHMYVNINEFYYEYSVVPLILFIAFSWFVFIFSSHELGQVGNFVKVAPSPTLIIISLLLLAQIIINSRYRLK